MQGISPINTCKQHLHDRLISQRGDIWTQQIAINVPCALEGVAVFVQFELTSSSTTKIKAEMRTFIIFTSVLCEVHVTLS
jgi:hypothetical protein